MVEEIRRKEGVLKKRKEMLSEYSRKNCLGGKGVRDKRKLFDLQKKEET